MRLVRQIFVLALLSCLSAAAQQSAAQQSLDGPNAFAKDAPAAPGAAATKDAAQPDAAQPAKDSAAPAGKDAPADVPAAGRKNSPGAVDPGPANAGPANAASANPEAAKEAAVPAGLVADRIFAQEAKLVENLRHYTPLVETYIQNLKSDSDLVKVPGSDRYFLGRLTLQTKGVQDVAFKDNNHTAFMAQVMDRLNGFFKATYHNVGFMQMIFLNEHFDKEHYQLTFLRRQFLGEVRTLVFDVMPASRKQQPYFVGRIWVEDQDYNIVRFNGTYGPNSEKSLFLHFDSWRMNLQPGLWLPAYIYTEESNAQVSTFESLTMKGQTRLWAYDLKHSGQQSEFTDLQVDAKDASDDSGNRGANEINPVQSQHMWEREAEDNVLDRMERAGLLAPDGEVSKVLQTVVNNLEITNNLNIEPEVRCRVLLTTPLESFTVGHTIIVSRGLLDVIPDESTLAMVLAQELGHVALGHRVDTRYSFSDRMIFPDERVFKQIGLIQNDEDERTADAKGLELLQRSPYKDKMNTAGLFLRALDSRRNDVTWLISPHFGNRFNRNNLIHATAVGTSPQLELRNIAQLPALPLGSRIKLDPWDDHVEMQKGKQAPLISARDKMSFEVTPMFPNLVRLGPSAGGEAAAKLGQ